MNVTRSAELLSIGTELLLGEIIDTNSSYLARSLASRSVDVYWSQRVGDNRGRIEAALRQALGRSDLVVVSGGLGPTDDDMTRESIAAVVGETPTVDPELERALRERFASFSRRMPEKNLKQAWLIPSAEALPNPLGTAPGWLVRTVVNGRPRALAALPGPPRELTRMWEQEVLPRLTLPTASFFSRLYKTHGIGESTVAERLGELTESFNPSVATYAKRDGVHVRVASKADDAAAALELARPALALVEERLGEYIWGRDGDELAELVVTRLRERGLSVAVAEGPTGGLLADSLSAVGGAAASFRGGMVAWSSQAMTILDPSLDVSDRASRESAAAMAGAVRSRFAADVGVATMGVAEPAGRREEASDEVFIAVERTGRSAVECLRLPPLGTSWRRERIAFATLFLLWSQLD